MTDFAAAMGLIQLEKLEDLNSIRRENAKKLTNIINQFNYLSTIQISDDIKPGYYGFPIFLEPNDNITRNELCAQLEEFGIETRPNMGGCLPDQPGFLNRNHRIFGDLKNARSIRDNAFFVGVHSGLTEDDFLFFSKALDKILN